MSKRRPSKDDTPPKKKAKIDPASRTAERKKPVLQSVYTHTHPVTGEYSQRIYRKDLDYLLKQSSRRQTHIAKKKQSRSNENKTKTKRSSQSSSQSEKKIEAAPTFVNLKDVNPAEVPMYKFTKRYKDQVCIVTGAGRGIGQAIAMRLAQEYAVVYVLDKVRWRETEKLIGEECKTEGEQRCFGMRCDVTNEDKVRECVQEIVERHGYIDVLINAVSGLEATHAKLTHDLDLKSINTALDTNLFSMLIITKEVLRYMRAEEYGRVVSIASAEGIYGKVGHLPYAMAKAAVIGATKTIGKEYAGTGITVNCVAPSYVDYQIGKKAGKEKKADKAAAGKTPIGRAAVLEEVAGLVAFVGSEENTYTTGFCYELSSGGM